MRHAIAILTALVLVGAASLCSAGGGVGTLGIGARGGILQPAGDDIEDMDMGPYFGGHASFGIIPGLTAIGSFNYGSSSSSVVDDAKLVFMPITAGVMYDLASFLPTGCMFTPSIDAGAGLYMWKAEVDGETVTVGDEKVEETDLGIYGGAGLEICVIPNLGIRPQVSFHYIFSADQDKYGEGDDNEYLITGGIAVTYYIPLIPMP